MKSTYRPSKPKQTAQDFMMNRISILRTKRMDYRKYKRWIRKTLIGISNVSYEPSKNYIFEPTGGVR